MNEIEAEARRTLEHFLTADALSTSPGRPGGSTTRWRAAASSRLPTRRAVCARRARVPLPLIELRAEFSVERSVLDALDRGASDADLQPVIEAARRLAAAEDDIVLGDETFGGMAGLGAASPHAAIPIGDDWSRMPRVVAGAIQVLRDAGVGGPYSVSLGSDVYTGVVETTEMGGYPVLEHLRLISGGPVLWAPTVNGALVLSTRGDDAVSTVGQDAAIGYLGYDDAAVRLYLEESLAFEVLTPEAAVRLTG